MSWSRPEGKRRTSPAENNKSEAELFKIIYSGVPDQGMPAYGDTLGKDNIWRLIAFIQAQ